MPVGRKLAAGVDDYVHEDLHGAVHIDTEYRASRAFAREAATLVACDRAARGHRNTDSVRRSRFRPRGPRGPAHRRKRKARARARRQQGRGRIAARPRRRVPRTFDLAAISAEIHAHAAAAENGWLRQAYEGGVDAAVLLAPMLGFTLPQAMLERTIDEVRAALGRGDFLARYKGADRVSGAEGEFLGCSSWLADAELAAGHSDRARALIERLIACANDVGLYAEEVDATSGATLLGNFPQALTHLGLIGNVVNLQLAERHGATVLHARLVCRSGAACRDQPPSAGAAFSQR